MAPDPVPSLAVLAIRAAAAEGRCPNCEAQLPEPRPAFCPACGQETRIAPPSLREFAQQLGGAYFSTEGALWRTLKLLLTKPGELTVQYLAGRRKHHVLPLRLYLSISVVVFVLVQMLGQVNVVIGLDRPELAAAERGSLPIAVLDLKGYQMGLRQGVFVCEKVPKWLCELVHWRAAPDTHTFLQRVRRANERVVQHLGTAMFVLLPLFAGCLRVLHLRRAMSYTEHLVFALHLHAFWFLVFLAMHLVGPPLGWIGALVMLVYALMAGRRVYGGHWLPRLLRGGALALMYAAMLAVTLPLLWLLALLA